MLKIFPLSRSTLLDSMHAEGVKWLMPNLQNMRVLKPNLLEYSHAQPEEIGLKIHNLECKIKGISRKKFVGYQNSVGEHTQYIWEPKSTVSSADILKVFNILIQHGQAVHINTGTFEDFAGYASRHKIQKAYTHSGFLREDFLTNLPRKNVSFSIVDKNKDVHFPENANHVIQAWNYAADQSIEKCKLATKKKCELTFKRALSRKVKHHAKGRTQRFANLSQNSLPSSIEKLLVDSQRLPFPPQINHLYSKELTLIDFLGAKRLDLFLALQKAEATISYPTTRGDIFEKLPLRKSFMDKDSKKKVPELNQESIYFAEDALEECAQEDTNIFMPDTLDQIAMELVEQGQFSKAIDLQTLALKQRQSLFVDQHTEMAASFNNIGINLNEAGRYDEALDYHYRALELRRLEYGHIHPYVADSFNNIGNTYVEIEKYAEALEQYCEALEIRKKFIDSDPEKVADSLNNIGNCFEHLKLFEDAFENYKEALSIRNECLPSLHKDIADSYSNMAGFLARARKFDVAYTYIFRALEILKKASASITHISKTKINLGLCLQWLKKNDEAHEVFKETLHELCAQVGGDHPFYHSLISHILSNLNSLNEFKRASELDELYHLCIDTFGENHELTEMVKQGA